MDETLNPIPGTDPNAPAEATNVPTTPSDTPSADPVAAATPQEPAAGPADTATTDEVATPAYVGAAPEAPYHLIDMEHAVINQLASHLDKAKEEAIAAITAVETAFSNSEVGHYKQRLLAWLNAQ